jgi:hypothetical protein
MRLIGPCVVSLVLAGFCVGQAPKATYDFSASREEKVRLATSAAPPEISDKATVYILESTGYTKLRDGSNGFTCLVEREYLQSLEPTCYDAEGSATTLKVRLYQEEQRAKGRSEEDINADIEKGYKSGKFLAPRKPGIVYMMSDDNHIMSQAANQVVHGPRHLMFYLPYATDKDLGSPTTPGMPFLIHPGKPDAVIIVMPREPKAK